MPRATTRPAKTAAAKKGAPAAKKATAANTATKAGAARTARPTPKVAAPKAPARKVTAKKVVAKKAPARPVKAAAKAAPPRKAVPVKAAAKAPTKAVAKKAPAKAVAKKAPAPVKKAPPVVAKKVAPKVPVVLDKFHESQRLLLLEERATYTAHAAIFQAEADLLAAEREPGDVQFDEESGEGDTLAVERERDLALSAQAKAAIEEIDKALEKIAMGAYGVCDLCGDPIPRERLKAIPHAALCVKCKSGGLGRR